MASTTKIMTALITLEQAAEDDKVVTITKQMTAVEGSSMGLQPGEQLRLSSLAAGMLSVSGNDAANSAAIAIDGSAEKFSERMNQRARELDMDHTHFVTPSGLDDDAHYSTAADMAKLTCAAMKNSAFQKIVSQKSIQVEFMNPQIKRMYANHNRLLSFYQGCIGVKTGFTKKAGRCLVSAAERDGVRVVAVTLNAPDDWNDHQKLLDEGFEKLQAVTFDDRSFTAEVPSATGETAIEVQGQLGDTVVLPKDSYPERTVELPQFLYAPIEKGQCVGRIVYRLNGQIISQTPILADSDVPAEKSKQSIFDRIKQFWMSCFP
jgi:D-alanyl-D-alanine carboxypeptidase/D-alanyl-D-alanine carboxypeptidase (penicillin-binding protein 5/6)